MAMIVRLESNGFAAASSTLTFNGGKPIDPDKVLTIAAVGDVLLHAPIQAWASANKGYAQLFAATSDLISGANVAFANLEGPAAHGVLPNGTSVSDPPDIFDDKVYAGYPRFNYHPSITIELRKAGFAVVNTGNNHALDRQQLGVDRTIEAIRAARLSFTGSRSSNAMGAPWYCITSATIGKKSFSIAWLGGTFTTNVPDPDHQTLLCYSDQNEIQSLVKNLSNRPDVHAVIVTPHWGVELRDRPQHKQISWAEQMANAGATAIIGQHPHVIQPVAKTNTTDGREVPVAYSLGNFVSGMPQLPCRASIILVLALEESRNGKLITVALGWIPIWMVTGDAYYAEPTRRSTSAEAKKYEAHVAAILPSGNMLPPQLPYWGGPAADA
jgi:poly-gamma-glutamate synthesis protein (capsule biosynthesis protein)